MFCKYIHTQKAESKEKVNMKNLKKIIKEYRINIKIMSCTKPRYTHVYVHKCPKLDISSSLGNKTKRI